MIVYNCYVDEKEKFIPEAKTKYDGNIKLCRFR